MISAERTVHKYELQITDMQEVEMPEGAKLLSAGEQHGRLVLWALVDPAAQKVKRKIRIGGTGHPLGMIDPDLHVASVPMAGGRLIWHIWDQGEE